MILQHKIRRTDFQGFININQVLVCQLLGLICLSMAFEHGFNAF